MQKKHLIGFCFLLLTFGSSVFFFPYQPLTSDKKLINNLYQHQKSFERIIEIANEDKNVMSVYKNTILLNGYTSWKNDNQRDFSNKRWNEYKKLFDQLGGEYIHRLSKEDGVIKIASASIATSRINEYESIVISKGYAYSLKKPSPLVESLDEMGFQDYGTFYKKVDKHWYIYFNSGVSKPE